LLFQEEPKESFRYTAYEDEFSRPGKTPGQLIAATFHRQTEAESAPRDPSSNNQQPSQFSKRQHFVDRLVKPRQQHGLQKVESSDNKEDKGTSVVSHGHHHSPISEHRLATRAFSSSSIIAIS
jgi:hypothetical protein